MDIFENIQSLVGEGRIDREALKETTVPPKTAILEEGEVARRLYFIRDGCLRLSFNNDGRDVTFQFFFPGNAVASFDSLYNRTPSLFSLESIERSSLVSMDWPAVRTLIERNGDVRNFYERFLAERFHTYQQLFLSRIRNTPEQRYIELLQQNPEIVRRIPQHYIASYLGITPVSLSRIRKRIKGAG